MAETKIIGCEQHDYFEIACMRRERIKLALNTGEVVSGVAVDLMVKERQEFIVVKKIEKTLWVNLLDINALTFLTDGRRLVLR